MKLPPTDRQEDAALPTLERPLHLLTFFTAKQPVWTLSGLARASGLPTASCLRAIRVLEKYQFLRRDHMEYRLGAQLLRLSAQVQAASPARRLASVHLDQLRRATGCPVSWSVLEGTEALTLDVLGTGTDPVPDEGTAGLPLDLTRGAVAQVLLAFASLDLRRAVLGPLTAGPLPDQPHREVLDGLTRKTWLALDPRTAGSSAELAAPVFQGNGALAAAIGLRAAVPSSRARLEHELHLLSQTAAKVSRELGYVREWHGDPAFLLQMLEGLGLLTLTGAAAVGSDLINYPA
ncbi:IclR family transcriptional regulator [Deinococcus gobiensis]|uniref:IclR family transcriptional regulator n=1 Tax=Deinococcus gobiensis (strain DSM 21396 / JCM 16679 / CGMCC 1.7299 / I-0) TaxID=745776 RepID=H8GXX8_DEIGI|nr:helix-turn-helix domain-containing protein [Deinococcus gobiensis]AFD24710.1 IclR family transcriptional regulator [Deinococcus gobiensis I-0]